MHFLEEIKDLKKYLMSWFWSFLIIAFTLFSVGVGKAEILGIKTHLPVLSSNSFSVMFFNLVKSSLVPSQVELIATSPSSAFVSQAIISLLGAFILTFPYLLYKFFQFLSPALYAKEQKKVLKILLPSMILFLGGIFFAYYVLIPPTFNILFSFNNTLGVIPFFAVGEFINWTLALMFSTGILFLLPIFMYILSWIGIISGQTWFRNWKIALATFSILSAIITPDGSGVTMILLTVPMMVLYMLGAFLSKKKDEQY